MTKEEIIDLAYGNYADVAKGLRDENGWIPLGRYYTYFPQDSERSGCGWFERPKSLQGIENNNDWIKIESEDDLPKATDTYHFVSRHTGKVMKDYFTADSKVSGFHNCQFRLYSHYQPIQKPQPPLY